MVVTTGPWPISLAASRVNEAITMPVVFEAIDFTIPDLPPPRMKKGGPCDENNQNQNCQGRSRQQRGNGTERADTEGKRILRAHN
jgi:hypothetical protein